MSTGVPYFPITLPAISVVGRLSAGAGPTEAIQIAQLASALTVALAAGTSLQVGSMAALRALAAPSALIVVFLQGYYSPGDGGDGFWYWNSADTTTDNTGTVVQPNAGGTGRWNRIYNRSAGAAIEWYGVVG